MKKIKPTTVHTARTIMFLELERVMDFSLEKDNYVEAMQNNVFVKKSQDGIKNTSAFLTKLYGFDTSSNKFKAFKYFWSITEEFEKELLAFIFALNKDYLLQESISVIVNCKIGKKVEIETLEQNIEKYHPNRFTKNTLRSVSQNIASSWKQAGFIKGKVKNIRTEPEITSSIISFAMLLAFIDGMRGDFIFQNNCIQSLCMSENRIRELALEASKMDFMQYQFAGSVTSISFDNLLNKIGINAI